VVKSMMEDWGIPFDPKNYFVFGTMEMSNWKSNQKSPLPAKEILDKMSSFIAVLAFKIQPAGWHLGEK